MAPSKNRRPCTATWLDVSPLHLLDAACVTRISTKEKATPIIKPEKVLPCLASTDGMGER